MIQSIQLAVDSLLQRTTSHLNLAYDNIDALLELDERKEEVACLVDDGLEWSRQHHSVFLDTVQQLTDARLAAFKEIDPSFEFKSVTQLQAELAEQTDQVAKLELLVGSLRERATELEALVGRLNEVAGTSVDARQTIAKLKQDAQLQQTELVSVTQEVQRLRQSAAEEAKLKNLNSKLIEENILINTELLRRHTAEADLLQKLNDLQALYNATQAEVLNLRSKLVATQEAKQQSYISADELKALSDRELQLQSEIESSTNEVAVLQSRLTSLQEEFDKVRLVATQSANDFVESQQLVETISAQRDAARDQVATLTENVNSLKSSLLSRDQSLNALYAEVTTYQSQIKDLETALAAAQAQAAAAALSAAQNAPLRTEAHQQSEARPQSDQNSARLAALQNELLAIRDAHALELERHSAAAHTAQVTAAELSTTRKLLEQAQSEVATLQSKLEQKGSALPDLMTSALFMREFVPKIEYDQIANQLVKLTQQLQESEKRKAELQEQLRVTQKQAESNAATLEAKVAAGAQELQRQLHCVKMMEVKLQSLQRENNASAK
jgi:chromosome segregation ATPase